MDKLTILNWYIKGNDKLQLYIIIHGFSRYLGAEGGYVHGVGTYMGWVFTWGGCLHGMGVYMRVGAYSGGAYMGWVLTQGRYVHGVGAYTGWVLTQENMAHVFTEHSMAYCVFQPVNSGENTACSPVFMLFVRLV